MSLQWSLRPPRRCTVLGAGLFAASCLSAAPASAEDEFWKLRTSPTDFSYYQLGTHIPPRGGRKPYPLARFVAAPDIGLPMAIDPKKGEHMYCNTQYYNLGGGGTPKGPDVPKVGVDSPENFYFPWTSNFCEKRGRSGDLACGTQYQEHMGQDCRPPKPTSRPTYDAAAVEDGTISGLSSDHIIKLESDRFVWSYLHLSRDRGLKKGDVVKKGDPIGKVWRNWGGKGTSLHLHIEGRFKDRGTYRVFDPLPSMIAAYQRALGNPYTVDDAGNLAYDAKFERTPGSAPPAIDPAKPPVVPPPATTSRPCEAALAEPPIGTEATYKFDSLWCHNGSVIGLASEGQSRALVYFKPKASVRTSATRDPVLVVARATEGQWSGTALHYSLACGDRRYPVAGTLGADGGRIEVSGFRDSFQSRDCSSVKVPESLAFTKIDAAPPAAPGAPVALPAPGATPPVAGQPSVGAGSPAPASSGGVAGGCPFALKPGEKPVGTGAAQRPPKSERTCNFNALTIPGGATLAQMPRYVREWPGLDPAGFLGDKFGDRIIAFNSAESGLGAWWYWIVKRAKHGPQLKKAGFGLNGKPTIAILARAVAGPSRSADYVRTIYLEPYRNFAEKYFGRRVGDDEPLPLDDPETRWNMGRMLLRLESGRDPVISRKQFDCGVAYGTDVMADFDRADVEAGGSTPIALTAFKGGAHYTVTCAGGQLAALDPAAAAGGVAVPPVVTPPASGAPAKPAAESPPVAKPPPAAGPAPPTAAPPATPEADTAVLARLSAEIEAAKATISQLRSAVANEARRADGADSARKAAESALNAARGTIADLERQIAARPPAVSPPPAATEPAPAATQSRLQSLERELSLMSELLGEVRARCKAEAALCKP